MSSQGVELFELLETEQSDDNPRLEAEIEKYYQNPYLLDAFLERFVRQLTKLYLQSNRQIQWPLHCLYTLSNVRGYKQVIKFLDTSPVLLEETVLHVTSCDMHWKSRYMLLLWISNLLLLPFDLETLGNDLFDTLFDICKVTVVKNSKERDAASLMMSRLITRSQSQKNSRLFLDWASDKPCIGRLQVLAHLSRSKVWYPSEFISMAKEAQGDIETKLAIKILSRVALQVFPSMLADTEQTINFVYDTLRHPSTILRYTSAKALARICKKLSERTETAKISESIIEDIITGFQDDQIDDELDRLSQVSDHRWHGSLLFLAETMRHSLPFDYKLLNGLLDDALHLEQKGLAGPVGANVRDAACYVCWSLFRFYKTIDDEFLRSVYDSLIALACFDREINVRRAAAAALQEGLGRHHGMEAKDLLELIQLLNFRSVGQVNVCYLELAPKIRTPTHLKYFLSHGVCSWDVQMRRLAAKSIGLYQFDAEDALIRLFAVPDQDVRHGVLCAVGNSHPKKTQKLEEILQYNFDLKSELVCEGILAFLQCLVDSNPELVETYMDKCMWASSEPVLAIIENLVSRMSVSVELARKWQAKWHQSPSYVVALGASPHKHLLNGFAELENPTSRTVAVKTLERSLEAEVAVINALSDYQRDRRGDVGSWVRMAALRRVLDWNLELSRLESPLWRMASESLDRLRFMSCKCLEQYGYKFRHDSTTEYFEDLIDNAPAHYIALGITTCVGGKSGNITLCEGALRALVSRLDKLGGEILKLGWKGETGSNVLRTVIKCLELGYGDKFNEKGLLRLGYNSTINTREIPRLMGGVEVLGFLTKETKAIERLVKLCASPSSAVRMRASEALFEAGIDDDVLMETDWAGREYASSARVLNERLLATY